MKAILLVRVSSDSQEFEEQKRSLNQYAQKFDYTENDLIIVENEESAMKQSLFYLFKFFLGNLCNWFKF